MKSHEIKREQKKSLFLRYISTIIQSITQDDPIVAKIYPTRVDFSADTGICYVYFATYDANTDAETIYQEAVKKLILYKPSMRAALAKKIDGRYTPDLLFLFDTTTEKVRAINSILDKVQEELSHVKDDEVQE